eukprot:748147_1
MEDKSIASGQSPNSKNSFGITDDTSMEVGRETNAEFSDAEVTNLGKGVERYGEGNWNFILEQFSFNSRSPEELCQKWERIQKQCPVSVSKCLIDHSNVQLGLYFQWYCMVGHPTSALTIRSNAFKRFRSILISAGFQHECIVGGFKGVVVVETEPKCVQINVSHRYASEPTSFLVYTLRFVLTFSYRGVRLPCDLINDINTHRKSILRQNNKRFLYINFAQNRFISNLGGAKIMEIPDCATNYDGTANSLLTWAQINVSPCSETTALQSTSESVSQSTNGTSAEASGDSASKIHSVSRSSSDSVCQPSSGPVLQETPESNTQLEKEPSGPATSEPTSLSIISESAPQITSELVSQVANEPMSKSMNGTTPQDANESTSQPANDATHHATNEPIHQAINDLIPHPTNESTSQATNDQSSDTTDESVYQTTNELVSPTSGDSMSEVSIELMSQTSNGSTPTDSVSQSPPDSVSQAPPDSVSQAPPDSVSQAPPDSVSQAPPDSVTQAPPDSVSQAPPDSVSQAPPDSVSQAPPDSVSQTPTDSVSKPTTESVSESINLCDSPSKPANMKESKKTSVPRKIASSLCHTSSDSDVSRVASVVSQGSSVVSQISSDVPPPPAPQDSPNTAQSSTKSLPTSVSHSNATVSRNIQQPQVRPMLKAQYAAMSQYSLSQHRSTYSRQLPYINGNSLSPQTKSRVLAEAYGFANVQSGSSRMYPDRRPILSQNFNRPGVPYSHLPPNAYGQFQRNRQNYTPQPPGIIQVPPLAASRSRSDSQPQACAPGQIPATREVTCDDDMLSVTCAYTGCREINYFHRNEAGSLGFHGRIVECFGCKRRFSMDFSQGVPQLSAKQHSNAQSSNSHPHQSGRTRANVSQSNDSPIGRSNAANIPSQHQGVKRARQPGDTTTHTKRAKLSNSRANSKLDDMCAKMMLEVALLGKEESSVRDLEAELGKVILETECLKSSLPKLSLESGVSKSNKSPGCNEEATADMVDVQIDAEKRLDANDPMNDSTSVDIKDKIV